MPVAAVLAAAALAFPAGGDRPLTPPVTVAAYDRALVEQLGLRDVARDVQREARRAGLRPPARFGTEVVARQLGLRYNHPAGTDARELSPGEPITRAEAAWSQKQIRHFDGWQVAYARQVLDRFRLPGYSGAQLRVLRQAVRRIGMPYVWGGESDHAAGQAHAGYDCSGFVWLVFQRAGVSAIGGRTTAARFAGAIPRSRRIRFRDVQPADALFFGPGRFRQRATERRIVHTGIALSRDFMIHSSSQGVYVSPLFEDWRREEFSWARRLV